MKAPISPESRHFGNHEADNFPHSTPLHELKRTPVSLTAPGLRDHDYYLTAEQLRLLEELRDKGLLGPGITVTVHDMTRFQSL